jgi:hypothetical protein
MLTHAGFKSASLVEITPNQFFSSIDDHGSIANPSGCRDDVASHDPFAFPSDRSSVDRLDPDHDRDADLCPYPGPFDTNYSY